MDRTQMGLRVRSARVSSGLTQVQLATKAQCDPTTLSRLEQGKIDVSAEILARIAVALGVTTDSLMLDTEDDAAHA